MSIGGINAGGFSQRLPIQNSPSGQAGPQGGLTGGTPFPGLSGVPGLGGTQSTGLTSLTGAGSNGLENTAIPSGSELIQALLVDMLSRLMQSLLGGNNTGNQPSQTDPLASASEGTKGGKAPGIDALSGVNGLSNSNAAFTPATPGVPPISPTNPASQVNPFNQANLGRQLAL